MQDREGETPLWQSDLQIGQDDNLKANVEAEKATKEAEKSKLRSQNAIHDYEKVSSS